MAPRNPFDPTGEKRLAALALEEQVVNLIRAGFSQHGVARKLGKSVSGVNKALRRAEARAKNRIVESVTILREKQAGQLDAWQDKLVEAFNAGQITIADLIDKGVKLQDRKAKLLGLDAPVKTETGEPGEFQSREEMYLSVRQKLAELMGEPQPPAAPPAALALPAPTQQPAAAPDSPAPPDDDGPDRIAAHLAAIRAERRARRERPPEPVIDPDDVVLDAEIVGHPSFAGVPLSGPANSRLPSPVYPTLTWRPPRHG